MKATPRLGRSTLPREILLAFIPAGANLTAAFTLHIRRQDGSLPFMSKRRRVRWAYACAAAAGLALASLWHAGAAAGGRPARAAKARQGQRVDIRLRSLTTRATGQLTVRRARAGGARG